MTGVPCALPISTTYATKTELSNANKRIDALDTGTFDVDLTTAGLAKIKANVTIGTSITLTKDTDFSEYLDYTRYKTVIFTLYIDNNVFFNDSATTEIYALSLHDALPISRFFVADVNEFFDAYVKFARKIF